LIKPNRDNQGEKAQFATAWMASAITMTIGGNDVGFAKILKSCIYTRHVVVGPFVPGNAGCHEREEVWKSTYKRLIAFVRDGKAKAPDGRKVERLARLLRLIATTAKQADIYIAGYPLLFEQVKSTKDKSCVVGKAKFGAKMRLRYDDIAWMNQTTALLNRQIRRVVREAAASGINAHYVNAQAAFANRGLCGHHKSWIYGLMMQSDKTHPKSGSFHPTRQGQTAYARAFEAAGATTA
jgi:hypothetical protein